MKLIIKYVAENGLEFFTKKECIKQDNLIIQVEDIMKQILPVTNNIDFDNGEYFIQQNLLKVKKVKFEILTLVKQYVDHHWIEQTLNDEKIYSSYVARLISEYTELQPLYLAWNRISNIDNFGREWGQQYYVLHPEESEALKNISK